MIEIDFTSDVTQDQRDAFLSAAARWDELVETELPPTAVNGRRISGILIEASIVQINKTGGVSGLAGPTHLRRTCGLPAKGIMQYDIADIRRWENNGSLADIITHGMGRVLGIGTLWDRFDLLRGEPDENPQFTGENAIREYGALLGGAGARPVPVANTIGAGTRNAHWRELVFGDELMTGFLSGNQRPISRVTVGSLEDIGYRVHYDAADPFTLPSFFDLAEKGIAEAVRASNLYPMDRPEPAVIDD